ncbi:hypothetical protein RFH42_14435 [Acinetobacter rudis]|uniref:hypothetical protein n=1 Tax=Acinetobacter rudis TaxID=632955 RepID=UPI00280ECAA4|nr:hypothetical protein [Acinetobacter rudis]MDQ8954149.1 hypothetical protein [Acinetobacter rudis]
MRFIIEYRAFSRGAMVKNRFENSAKLGSFDHCVGLKNIDKCSNWGVSISCICFVLWIDLFNFEKIALQCKLLYVYQETPQALTL